MIVWNIFQMSTDIRVELSGWDRYLRVWNIWTGPSGVMAMFSETKFLGWVRMIVLNILQKSMDIRLKLSDWDRPLRVWTIWAPRKLI